MMNAVYFLLEYIKDNMLLPGQVENWIILIDFENAPSLFTDGIKKLVNEIQQNYVCRLAFGYVLYPNKAWTELKEILSQHTLKKFSTIRDITTNPMLRHFTPTQLEQKYGGSAADLTEFWPPMMPEGNLLTEFDDPVDFTSNYSTYNEYYPDFDQSQSDISASLGRELKDSMFSDFRADQLEQAISNFTDSFSFRDGPGPEDDLDNGFLGGSDDEDQRELASIADLITPAGPKMSGNLILAPTIEEETDVHTQKHSLKDDFKKEDMEPRIDILTIERSEVQHRWWCGNCYLNDQQHDSNCSLL